MSGFSVLPVSLEETAAALVGVAGEIAALAKAPLTNSAALGGGGVDAALDSFHGSWGYAISQLDGHVQNVVSNMHKAAINYQDNECLIASAEWQ